LAAISVSRELCPCVPFEVVLIDIPALVERDEGVLRCANLGTSSRRSTSACPVKVHRGCVIEKMRAGSVAELVRLADGVGESSSRRPDAAATYWTNVQ